MFWNNHLKRKLAEAEFSATSTELLLDISSDIIKSQRTKLDAIDALIKTWDDRVPETEHAARAFVAECAEQIDHILNSDRAFKPSDLQP